MANDLQVSVLTVRRVYDELEKEGFVSGQAGLGTFVTAGNMELLKEAKRRTVEKKLAALIDEAKMLGIECEETVAMIKIFYEEK